MRKYYLDNIRWITVVIVVLYHVFYMYNAEGILGVVGRITNLKVQYYDMFQYIVYPWFMVLLFIVSGISARLSLTKQTDRAFIRARTRKLLVPSTIGLAAFQFLQGYVNTAIAGFFESAPDLPAALMIIICIASGIGVLWYIQLLWVYSMLLVAIRRIEKDRIWDIGGKATLPVLIALVLPVYGAAQILNTPIIAVYRIGLYLFTFLMGYFVFSHDEVTDILMKWFPLFLCISAALGAAFCVRYFGANYADAPINRTWLFAAYGWFASLAVLGGMAKYGSRQGAFSRWMSSWSFGLYVFHYLGISTVALLIGKRRILPAPAVYLLSAVAGFAGAYLLYAVISRIPGYRWAVLGMKGERSREEKEGR